LQYLISDKVKNIISKKPLRAEGGLEYPDQPVEGMGNDNRADPDFANDAPGGGPEDVIAGEIGHYAQNEQGGRIRQEGDSDTSSQYEAIPEDIPPEALTDVQSPYYRFDPDAQVKLRFIPYNPFFPTVEKVFSNGDVVNVGRYQRTNGIEDPNGEGIYYRSTVVSRYHASISFQDGEVSSKN
jgi:hypothetical protein